MSLYICQKLFESMIQEESTLASAFGLENPKELFKHCLEISLTTDNCSEILNKLICSHLTTKEMVYCAFICGKLQEMDDETAALLAIQKKFEIFSQSK